MTHDDDQRDQPFLAQVSQAPIDAFYRRMSVGMQNMPSPSWEMAQAQGQAALPPDDGQDVQPWQERVWAVHGHAQRRTMWCWRGRFRVVRTFLIGCVKRGMAWLSQG